MQQKVNKLKSIIYSVAGAAVLLIFWSNLNRSQDGSDQNTSEPITQMPATDSAGPVPQVQDVATENIYEKYLDGTYEVGNMTPWGEMRIKIDIKNGQWKEIIPIQIPDSPPHYYSVKKLIEQALQEQSDEIQGVSGATYTSLAFRDDLTEIIRQSKL